MHSLFILIQVIVFFSISFSCNKQELVIGDPAPELQNMNWLQSPKLKIADLKGKVVLMRWWTDECMYCVNSANALNGWHDTYNDSGLVIIGLYHPKPFPQTCNPDKINEFVLDKKFRFPIAIDDDWFNLKKYWLDAPIREFTSVSFLLDRKGIIKYIHPGGEYHKDFSEGHKKCVDDYFSLEKMIQNCVRSK